MQLCEFLHSPSGHSIFWLSNLCFRTPIRFKFLAQVWELRWIFLPPIARGVEPPADWCTTTPKVGTFGPRMVPAVSDRGETLCGWLLLFASQSQLVSRDELLDAIFIEHVLFWLLFGFSSPPSRSLRRVLHPCYHIIQHSRKLLTQPCYNCLWCLSITPFFYARPPLLSTNNDQYSRYILEDLILRYKKHSWAQSPSWFLISVRKEYVQVPGSTSSSQLDTASAAGLQHHRREDLITLICLVFR